LRRISPEYEMLSEWSSGIQQQKKRWERK
jgi:hypothetical protein